jgi:hypothetical protein
MSNYTCEKKHNSRTAIKHKLQSVSEYFFFTKGKTRMKHDAPRKEKQDQATMDDEAWHALLRSGP